MLNRLEMLRIFCAAADAGSFKDAAIHLGISPQAVTRAIQELERLQGEMLFHRNTRQVRITSFGEQLAERARSSLQQLDGLFAPDPASPPDDMSGVVRLAAPSALGRSRLLPIVERLANAHPGLRFDLRLTDQRADVVGEKIDIGIRVGALRDNRFVVRRLGKTRFHVVATPRFLRRHGTPARLEDLPALPCTGILDRDTGRLWPWMFAGDRQMNADHARFVCDDSEAEYLLVRDGMAIGQIAGFLCDDDIAAGRLVPVLGEHEPEPWDTYLYRPQRGPVPPRLRLVFDTLVQELSD
ncbi:LysR family transcriptional regulator [Herbaspirillum sp. BH-1]|uniref:DNA-binding transcriptional LysR family regulator n=1 Tax=Herbaspirillum frisingense TaxID=92645 RepID=A0ABU1PJS1_9BURK|nr:MULTISPECIES: LysR family transcriptional regulator [Herbaspirillum]MCI1016328.1 LysR family transcriptional regulator [Herbaspirillum sp. C7C2]MDR6586171.1 DNA-binding transcriptional LysR family regulator [Herbaspirillum frisingense]ONN67273.1 LysR family transcriptional regulator [Herbaspirillum sp. VT-16-41]PLY58901.1 LysR family transcriptional regulator [Herbaspirillum sp. BH-1]